jgi:hypothetical protein
MNIIPIDIVNLIFEYLYFSSTTKKIFFINKIFYKTIKQSKFIEKYFIIQERFNMYLEDYLINKHKNFLELWSKYNFWKWENKKNKELVLKKKVYVDVLDKVYCWCPGFVKNIYVNINGNCFEKKMEVEFLGWTDHFNENVTIDKIKPFGSKYLDPLNLYESLKKQKHKCWILYNKNNFWNNSRLITIEVNKNNIIVLIDDLLVKIDEKTIHEKIKVCSNANYVLCKSDKTIFNRNFDF